LRHTISALVLFALTLGVWRLLQLPLALLAAGRGLLTFVPTLPHTAPVAAGVALLISPAKLGAGC